MDQLQLKKLTVTCLKPIGAFRHLQMTAINGLAAAFICTKFASHSGDEFNRTDRNPCEDLFLVCVYVWAIMLCTVGRLYFASLGMPT